MDLSDFAGEYARMPDEELLATWADRDSLVPEAVIVLETELQTRGLKMENAARAKRRLEALVAREKRGPLIDQVASANYERKMRHFVGWEEPEYDWRYRRQEMRNAFGFGYLRHKYRVWKTFFDHTGHWPVFSIWFYFLSWIAVAVLALEIFLWAVRRNSQDERAFVTTIGFGILILLGLRGWGARLMRRLDWRRYGPERQPR